MTDNDTTTTDSETHRTVDISNADAADAVADTSAGAEAIRERAKSEAERYLQNADGQTATERAENALQELRETVKQTEQQLRACRQQKQEKESRREKLADTRLRVENQPHNQPIMQTLGGGITLEVPHPAHISIHDVDGEEQPVGADPDHDGEWDGVYDRDDLVADIEDTRDQLAEQCESLDEQASQLQDALATAEKAFERLQDYREMAAVEDHKQGQGRPEHAGAPSSPDIPNR